MHPDYVYFWYHLNDHSSASTLGILMRIPHNQDTICIFVVFEAWLLAILLAKDPVGSIFQFFDKVCKILRKFAQFAKFLTIAKTSGGDIF